MEVVAHRAGNTVEAAQQAAESELVDMIELDVHVLRGVVELRHAKVLHPTRRLWEQWYLLPRGTKGVPIQEVLAVIPPTTPLMVDLKCFTRRSARLIRDSLPAETPIVASTRNWWILSEFADRPNTRRLRSVGAKWQLWWATKLSRYGNDDGICIKEFRLVPEVTAQIHRKTPMLFSWGATTEQRAIELRDAGLTGIILDHYALAPNRA